MRLADITQDQGRLRANLNTDSFSGQWDNHGNLKGGFDQMLPVYDRMLTALLDDLAERRAVRPGAGPRLGRVRPDAEDQRRGRPRPLAAGRFRPAEPAAACAAAR